MFHNSFRHTNRDAVLVHVKVHFPDNNQNTIAPKTLLQLTSNNNNDPMQLSNPYMNKILAAMSLSQQQQQQHNNHANVQLSNLMAAGLLEQTNNNHFSGLALALAGKSPLKATHLNAAANILEHGEQKASLNEASAQNTMTSPNQLKTLKTLQNSQMQTQTLATSASPSSSSSSVTGVGSTTTATTTSTNSPSLQHLLTSPRGSFTQNDVLNNNNNSNNETMVMGSAFVLKNPTTKSGLMTSPPSPATPNTIVTTTTTPSTPPPSQISSMPSLHSTYQLKQSPPFSLHSGEGDLGILTASATGVGDIITGVLQDHHNMVMGATFSNTSNNDHHLQTTTSSSCNNNMANSLNAAASSSTCSTSLLSLSNQNQNYIQNQNHSSSSNNNNNSNNNLGNLSGNGVLSNNNNNNNNYNNGNGTNNNSNNLLTHDTTTADRRDPSPYRCGHCHQVSNWKHVIQVLF